MQKLSICPPATRHAQPLADHASLNGHATPERGSKPISLIAGDGAALQSRVLLQRPVAHVEPFAPGAGLGYVARRPFHPQSPLLPGASPFVGGFEFWNFRIPPAGVLVALLSRHGNAAWRIRGNAGNGSRYFGLWLLPKSAFSQVDSTPLALAHFSSLAVRISTNHRNHFAARFVVQNGDDFYLSRSGTDRTGNFVLTGSSLAEQRWARYRPSHDLRANTAPEGWTSYSSLIGGAALLPFETGTLHVNDVRAVGLYVEAINCSSRGDRCLEWEELQATLQG